MAGLASPALLDLFVVSINSGVNLLLGFGVSVGGGLWGIEVGVGSGVGNGFPVRSLLLLNVVSTGVGAKRRFPVAESFFSTAVSLPPCLLSFLLLRAVVSKGSGANRRTFFTVSSTGTAWKRLVGGGDVPAMMRC